MMRRLGAIAVAMAMSLGAQDLRAETWIYRVALNPADPLLARVVVELPAERRAQDFSVQVRGMADGLMPQVSNLRCDGRPLAPDSASAWLVQGWSCVRLTWTVAFSATEGQIDPRRRESLYDDPLRFWLFSEATSLLRPVGATGHAGEVEFIGAAPVNGGAAAAAGSARLLVPATGQPQEFYVIGRLPGASVREGGFDTLHLDALGVEWHGFLAQQGRALRYLTRAAGARQLAPSRTTVVWLSGPTDDGAPVTVAGNRTLLVSAAKRDGHLRSGELALAWIVREQLLQAIPDRVPPWARQGLAQYYAVKALRHAELPATAMAAVDRRFVDPSRPPARLPELQRRAQAGDAVALVELRDAGAVFWERLDRAIVRKSGFRTLDSVLPRLLAADWPEGRLPDEVVRRLRDYAADSTVDDLLAQYVGG